MRVSFNEGDASTALAGLLGGSTITTLAECDKLARRLARLSVIAGLPDFVDARAMLDAVMEPPEAMSEERQLQCGPTAVALFLEALGHHARAVKAHRQHGQGEPPAGAPLDAKVQTKVEALRQSMTVMAGAIDVAVAAALMRHGVGGAARPPAPPPRAPFWPGPAPGPWPPRAPPPRPGGRVDAVAILRSTPVGRRAGTPCPFLASANGCSRGQLCQFKHA